MAVLSRVPVKEEDDIRHVSSPVKGKYGRARKSTIRLVDEDDAMYPLPLKIRKKASILLPSSPRVERESSAESSAGRLRMAGGV